MASASITIRMDAELKRQAESLFDSMGMNMTTAFTVFAKTAVREGRIPFEIKGDPFWTDANQARIRQAARDLDAGINCAQHELIEEDVPS